MPESFAQPFFLERRLGFKGVLLGFKGNTLSFKGVALRFKGVQLLQVLPDKSDVTHLHAPSNTRAHTIKHARTHTIKHSHALTHVRTHARTPAGHLKLLLLLLHQLPDL